MVNDARLDSTLSISAQINSFVGQDLSSNIKTTNARNPRALIEPAQSVRVKANLPVSQRFNVMFAATFVQNPNMYSKNVIPETISANGFGGLEWFLLTNARHTEERLYTMSFVGVGIQPWRIDTSYETVFMGDIIDSENESKQLFVSNLQAGEIVEYQMGKTTSFLFSPVVNFQVSGRTSLSLNYWAGVNFSVFNQKTIIGISHANVFGLYRHPMNDLISNRGNRISLFVDFSFGL